MGIELACDFCSYVNDYVLDILWRKGYSVVKWNHDPNDWALNSSAELESNFFGSYSGFGTQDSLISLQHDTKASTIDAQAGIIRKLKKLGWKLVTISEF